MAHILIIDDEQGIRDTVAMIFEYDQHSVTTAASGAEGLKLAEDPSTQIDCILLDVKMPGMDGLECLERLKELRPEVPVIMISGHGTIETAVEATKKGAFDFVEKPPDRQRLLLLVRNATEKKQLVSENRVMRERLNGREQMLGTSVVMRNIREVIQKVAPTEARILITGENGTGKELVARAIHRQSKRHDKPFVEVNCAAIPKDLIESELFGHEKGSFTGASAQRIGKFEQADNGTLFLDEVGDMSMEAQAKVLRVIQEGTLERVGSSSGKPIHVNVRILAATNKDLPEEIKKGRFREDLYHRLSVIPIYVAPLRERREDIPDLLQTFCKEFGLEMNRKPLRFDDAALKVMMSLPYTGNIRELRNIVERIVILVSGDVVHVEDVNRLGLAFALSDRGSGGSEAPMTPAVQPRPDQHAVTPETPASAPANDGAPQKRVEQLDRDRFALIVGNDHPLDTAMEAPTFQEFKERAEKAYIEEKLREFSYNISRTAEALDIQRSHLYTKMRKFGLMKGGASGDGAGADGSLADAGRDDAGRDDAGADLMDDESEG